MEATQENFSASLRDNISKKKDAEARRIRLRNGAFVIGISGVTAVIAGVLTSRRAKRKGAEYFREHNKEIIVMTESPTALAFRALGWATVISVGICSLTVFGICQWYKIKSLDDLRNRVRQHTRKQNETKGRSDFENLTDLINYINETSQEKSKTGESKDSPKFKFLSSFKNFFNRTSDNSS